MTSKEKAKAIRAALKEAGITSKQVSVKHRYCGYSSSYHITIKNGNISEMQVKNICKRFRSVDYDERTGEILEGGNDYVLVNRDNNYPVDGSEYLDAVKNALAKLERDGQGEKIEGTRWTIFKEGNRYFGSAHDCRFVSWDLSHFFAWNGEGVAGSIANIIKSREIDLAYLARKSA